MEQIGSGNSGTVYKGVMKSSSVAVALKEVTNPQRFQELRMEAAVLKGLDHPNVVRVCRFCKIW